MLETKTISGDGWQTGVLVDSGAYPSDAPMLTPTLGEYPIYDAPLYEVMANDTERNWRFCEALERYAKDRIVIDIGTGAFLFWARESLRFGARRALAVEAMQGSFEAGSQLLKTLEDGDRITLLHGDSTKISIKPKADVCVAEIVGSLPGAEGAAAVLRDAKQRHLTPDAVIIPHLCLTQAAAASFTGLFAGRPPAFSASWISQIQQIFDWNDGPFDVRLRLANPAPEGLLSDTAAVERLDFNGDLVAEQVANVQLTMTRPGMVDGVLTWLWLQCLPDQPPLDALHCTSNWGSIFLPLFEESVQVEAGDVLNLTVRTTLSEDGIHPDYHLSGELHTAHGVHHGEQASPYKSSDLHGHAIYRTLFPE